MFEIVPFSTSLGKMPFSCAVAQLDDYFHRRASQDVRRNFASCFVAVTKNGDVAAYYTLSAASILLDNIPEDLRRKLPRYPSIPAVRLGRLAVSVGFQGIGLGAAMLYDSWKRSIGLPIGLYAMTVHAKDEKAAAFYAHNGFFTLADSPLDLYIPLALCRKLITEN
ncbi:MAG: GNAT family N-acetyltransferase [Desulfovibrio sp.]|nr:GNAT family N-acetyltransferase [Desulfovibrio sp.]